MIFGGPPGDHRDDRRDDRNSFEDTIDFDEFLENLEDLYIYDRGGAPGETNWEMGYESEMYSPVTGVSSYIMAWNCEDTGNVAYITYSDDFDEYDLWGAISVCPESYFQWWYVLVFLIVVGLGYFSYVNKSELMKRIKRK
tara:strand:- start:232 stop:651 length:420 start_codon:yes stop_codon:yes gene_type:complete